MLPSSSTKLKPHGPEAAILIIELKGVRNHRESGPGAVRVGVRQIESGSI